MGETITMDFQKVRDAFMRLRTTAMELSRKSGVSYVTIRNVLKENRRVRPCNAMKIADALGVRVEDLKA